MHAKDKAIGAKSKFDIKPYIMILILVGIWIFFFFSTDATFLSFRNISNLFRQMSVITVLSVGVFFVILAGNFDLSVGSQVGMHGAFLAMMMVNQGIPLAPALLLCVIIGIAIGVMNGVLVSYVEIPAFIVTLGGYLAFKGIMLAATGASTIAVNNEMFNAISSGYIGKIPGMIVAIIIGLALAYMTIQGNEKKKKLGISGASTGAAFGKGIGILALCVVIALVLNAYEGIPYLFIIMLIVVGVFTFIAEYTTFGRHLYAIGGNAQASRYTGINVKFNVLMTYIISGMLSAVAAILLVSRVGAATTTAGTQYEMDAIAAAVIGGCSLAGGIGHVYGVLIGGLVMTTLDNGMSIMNVDSFWQYIVKGIVLVGAVAIDVLSNKQKAK